MTTTTTTTAPDHESLFQFQEMKKFNVAVIGSTGGGTATLGHTDPPQLIRIIHHELTKVQGCRAGISTALLVALKGGQGFDSVGDGDNPPASLYQAQVPSKSDHGGVECHVIASGGLEQVNQQCQQLNQELAREIAEGHVDALIGISMSVDLFADTLEAAAKAGIPVTGTGGTSLSLAAAKFGIRLVGNAGGSVANTSLTRAVSYTHALATDWNRSYRPWTIHTNTNHATICSGPRWRSTLNACLPAFWGVCLLRKILLSAIALLESFHTGTAGEPPPTFLVPVLETLSVLISFLEQHALPTACAVVMAISTQSSSTGTAMDVSSRIMASVLASTAASRSILAGMVAGHLVATWQERVLFACVVQNVPATMTNLLATGGVGTVLAMILVPVNPLLQTLTSGIRQVIHYSVTTTSSSSPYLGTVGALVWGCLCCYGSKVGWYHAIFLPLILIEMELGTASFLGAIDELTLVLVCAGVCAGNLVSATLLWPRLSILSEADLALCWRAVRINLLYGDFVEACYPEMERYWLVNRSGYLASGLSSALLVALQQPSGGVPQSLAYLPWPVAVWLAGRDWWPMLVASAVAFGIPFGTTILNNFLREKHKRD